MKTAAVEEAKEHWPKILRWVAAREEVQVTEQNKVVAKVIPPASIPQPDFLKRAQAIWGERPEGKLLSEIVAER